LPFETDKARLEELICLFFRSLLGPTILIGKDLNLRKQFFVADSDWFDLSPRISEQPWAVEMGLVITFAQMANAHTIEDIATSMLAGRDALPPFAKPSIALEEELTGETESFKVTDNVEYRVWYGTNRSPRDLKDTSKGFSSDRDVNIRYGICKVFIPRSHKIGSQGSSWLKRVISMTDDRLKLLWVGGLTQADFWQQLGSQMASVPTNDRHAVVFLHGYNVSFTDAATRAAQIGFDLNVKGAMVFFSWPSQGALGGYPADEATIDASETSIVEFLTDFVDKSCAEHVHIIAHSMGNRGLLRAVQRISERANAKTGKIFDQIILAAPDVDADVFRELCAAYKYLGQQTTLYVSQKDRAVDSSRWLHKFPRVGFAPPIFVTTGIDTVNVTNVDLSLLGHGYVAESRDVLADIHSLITNGLPPEERFGLKKESTENLSYWLIGA
jgi:esterase/lipase superfamily enzyme